MSFFLWSLAIQIWEINKLISSIIQHFLGNQTDTLNSLSLSLSLSSFSESNHWSSSVHVLLYAERRVVGLKKGIEGLRSELDAANAELEDAKRAKETAEQELKGYEVELARNEVSIQTLEVLLLRISCQFVIEFLLNLIQSSQLVFNVITFDFFQARISLIQDEISTVGSDLEALKVLSRLLFSPIFSLWFWFLIIRRLIELWLPSHVYLLFCLSFVSLNLDVWENVIGLCKA